MAKQPTRSTTTSAASRSADRILSEQQERTERENAEKEARMSGSTPTPTQAENDATKLGQAPAELEADGSAEQGTGLLSRTGSPVTETDRRVQTGGTDTGTDTSKGA